MKYSHVSLVRYVLPSPGPPGNLREACEPPKSQLTQSDADPVCLQRGCLLHALRQCQLPSLALLLNSAASLNTRLLSLTCLEARWEA